MSQIRDSPLGAEHVPSFFSPRIYKWGNDRIRIQLATEGCCPRTDRAVHTRFYAYLRGYKLTDKNPISPLGRRRPSFLDSIPACSRSNLHPSDHAGETPSYAAQSDHSGKRLLRILLTYPFLPRWEARRSCPGGAASMYNSTMEHIATVIICKKNPNVSGSGISPETRIRAPETCQDRSQTEANRRRDRGELESLEQYSPGAK